MLSPVRRIAGRIEVDHDLLDSILSVLEGLKAALQRKRRQRPPREVTFDGAFEARLIALACSPAPEGLRRWTVRLLAEKVVELGLAPQVSPMTVQRLLKKTNCSLT